VSARLTLVTAPDRPAAAPAWSPERAVRILRAAAPIAEAAGHSESAVLYRAIADAVLSLTVSPTPCDDEHWRWSPTVIAAVRAAAVWL
jgi:hypothetical protein